MAQVQHVLVGALTVAVGATTSNIIGETTTTDKGQSSPIADALWLTLVGPSALAGAASGTVLVSRTPGATPTVTLESAPGTAWAIPLVDKVGKLPEASIIGLRLSVNAAVTGADAVWYLYKTILV